MSIRDQQQLTHNICDARIPLVGKPVEIVADYGCDIGENPLWHPSEGKLYWTDIGSGRLFRYDPESGQHEQCYSGRPVGGFSFQEDGSMLLFLDRGSVAVWRPGETVSIMLELEAEQSTRFNDVFADPQGRVFCGTMSTPERKGHLYRLEPDLTCTLVLNDIGCSNGMALSLDQRTFYYTDSLAHVIYAFDYEVVSGELSHQRRFVEFPRNGGLPDGITMNSAGELWVALWDGGKIVKLSSHGQLVEEVFLPTQKVSSVAFGGKSYSDLFITTGGGRDKAGSDDHAGALFRCEGLLPGIPGFTSKINCKFNARE